MMLTLTIALLQLKSEENDVAREVSVHRERGGSGKVN